MYNTDTLFSYHIFSFPFKWKLKNEKQKDFSDLIDLRKIKLPQNSLWQQIPQPQNERLKRELYNEKNFFYDFTYNALYDNNNEKDIISHFERKEIIEGTNAAYIIYSKNFDKTYELNIKSICLNIYSTGVGILVFYLENHKHTSFTDILNINQFGRRIYPPYLSIDKGVEGTKNTELAGYIALKGLAIPDELLYEDFADYDLMQEEWKPGKFICTLLSDIKETNNLKLAQVIDDRMFVCCWCCNNELSNSIKSTPYNYYINEDLYKYIFIDASGSCTCQNDIKLRKTLIENTLTTWQKLGTIYGFSRYSLVAITENNEFSKKILLTYFRTMYYRMAELCLVQRASILKFSDEVTDISTLHEDKTKTISKKVSTLYKEYIRFVNKVYFREVTAQDQGIEIYNKMQSLMKIPEQVKDLDNEIEELHNYITLKESEKQNENVRTLSVIAAIFVIPTLIFSFYGMNLIDFQKLNENPLSYYPAITLIVMSVFIIGFTIGFISEKRKFLRNLYLILAILILIFSLFLPLIINF